MTTSNLGSFTFGDIFSVTGTMANEAELKVVAKMKFVFGLLQLLKTTKTLFDHFVGNLESGAMS